VIAGDRGRRVGNERGLCRAHALDERLELDERVPLDVQLDARVRGHEAREVVDVVRLDVTLVGPGVNRDPMCARLQAELRAAKDARHVELRSRVPERRDLVHVDRKLRHRHRILIRAS